MARPENGRPAPEPRRSPISGPVARVAVPAGVGGLEHDCDVDMRLAELALHGAGFAAPQRPLQPVQPRRDALGPRRVTLPGAIGNAPSGAQGARLVVRGFMAPPLEVDASFFALTDRPPAVCPFCEPGMP